MFMQRLTDHVLRIVCLREAKGEGTCIYMYMSGVLSVVGLNPT